MRSSISTLSERYFDSIARNTASSCMAVLEHSQQKESSYFDAGPKCGIEQEARPRRRHHRWLSTLSRYVGSWHHQYQAKRSLRVTKRKLHRRRRAGGGADYRSTLKVKGVQEASMRICVPADFPPSCRTPSASGSHAIAIHRLLTKPLIIPWPK